MSVVSLVFVDVIRGRAAGLPGPDPSLCSPADCRSDDVNPSVVCHLTCSSAGLWVALGVRGREFAPWVMLKWHASAYSSIFHFEDWRQMISNIFLVLDVLSSYSHNLSLSCLFFLVVILHIFLFLLKMPGTSLCSSYNSVWIHICSSFFINWFI